MTKGVHYQPLRTGVKEGNLFPKDKKGRGFMYEIKKSMKHLRKNKKLGKTHWRDFRITGRKYGKTI